MNYSKYSKLKLLKSKTFKMVNEFLFISIVRFFDRVSLVSGDERKKEDDLIKIQSMLREEKPLTWIFTGDSITQGAKHTHGYRSYPEVFAERIRYEIARRRDIVINTALSGNNTTDIINEFDWRIKKFEPSVVSLMIGTNDAAIEKNISFSQFANNLTELINRIRKIGAIPILMSPNIIITEEAHERDRLGEYVSEMMKVVEVSHVVFVDNWMIWNTDLQTKYNGEVFHKLLNDPLHPNGYGHKEIAMALFKKLSIFNPDSPACGGEYYEGEH